MGQNSGGGIVIKTYPFVLCLIAQLFTASQALAIPVFGQDFYYQGGGVEVTVLPNTADYQNEIFIISSTLGAIPLATNRDVGLTLNLGNLFAFGYQTGDAVVFGINVTNTGDRFVMGPGSSNPDGLAHASLDYVEDTSSNYAVVSFEDLWSGGDRDYDDAVFKVTGVGPVLTPEPASCLLMAFGLAGFFFAARRRGQTR